MLRSKEIVLERIKNGNCPICGKKTDGKSAMVCDPNFGELFICDHHIVQGLEKLREADVPCDQPTEKSVVPDATNGK